MQTNYHVIKENINIATERSTLRILLPSDASEQYLNWFIDPEITAYIESRPKTIEQLQSFITSCFDDDAIFLFGIFNHHNRHIGNIKFEFITKNRLHVDMGILIGEPIYRGVGLAPEVIKCAGQFFKQQFGTQKVVLGVSKTHKMAIKSYSNMGFVTETEPLSPIDYEQGILMSWLIE